MKCTSLHGTTSIGVFYVKMAVGDWKNQKNEKIAETKGCAKSRMRRDETPYPICIKFGLMVGICDIITYANFCEDRLRGF